MLILRCASLENPNSIILTAKDCGKISIQVFCWWKQYKVSMEITEESHFTFKSHFITKSGSDTCRAFSEVFDWSASHILYDLIINLKWVLWTVADRDLSWAIQPTILPNYHGVIFLCLWDAQRSTCHPSSWSYRQLCLDGSHLNCPHSSEDGKYNSELSNKAIFKWISLSYMTCYA